LLTTIKKPSVKIIEGNNGNIKQLLQILKCSFVKSKTEFMLKTEENDKASIGSTATLTIG
jgi:hypothetical protein